MRRITRRIFDTELGLLSSFLGRLTLRRRSRPPEVRRRAERRPLRPVEEAAPEPVEPAETQRAPLLLPLRKKTPAIVSAGASILGHCAILFVLMKAPRSAG